MARSMRVGDTVKHDSGWTAKVEKIEGKVAGNRAVYLEGHRDPFLECVLTVVPRVKKYSKAAERDAAYLAGFEPGTPWATGAFRPNREKELVEMGMLVPVPNARELDCAYTVGMRAQEPNWIPGSWEVCRVEDLVAGDRVSFEEDALYALDDVSAEFGPEAINWDYVRADSRVVDFRAYADVMTVWRWVLYFQDSGQPVAAVANGRLVREVRKP